MPYKTEMIYHVFNRGNNKRVVFPRDENYLYFLDKMKKHLLPHADLLCYCLMPNHFHILLQPKLAGCIPYKKRESLQPIGQGIRTLLSSYSRGINLQNQWTGSLFQKRTKAKPGWGRSFDQDRIYAEGRLFAVRTPYVIHCFRYIHENPVKAKMVNRPYDWEYSSAKDYVGLRNDNVCNYGLAEKALGIKKFSSFEAYLARDVE